MSFVTVITVIFQSGRRTDIVASPHPRDFLVVPVSYPKDFCIFHNMPHAVLSAL